MANDIPLTPLAKAALVGILTGDRALQPAGEALLNTQRKRALSLGDGFVLDPDTGKVAQDPAYASYQFAVQGALDERQQRLLDSQERRQDARDRTMLEATTSRIDAANRAAAARQQQADADKAQREAAWQTKTNQSAAQKFAGQMQAAGIPALQDAAQGFLSGVQPYIDQGKNVPGIGGLSNYDVGAALLNANDPAGKDIHARYSAIRNNYMRMISGANVTDQERQRLAAELSAFPTSTDADVVKQVQYMLDRANDLQQRLAAGMSPDAYLMYQQNQARLAGGVTPAMTDSGASGGAGANPSRPSTGGAPTGSPGAPRAGAPAGVVQLNGKSYRKLNGQWHEVQ